MENAFKSLLKQNKKPPRGETSNSNSDFSILKKKEAIMNDTNGFINIIQIRCTPTMVIR